jgi:phosphate transport system permease protein
MRRKEKIIEVVMMCCSFVTVFTTIGIILILTIETVKFFSGVSIVDFITDTQWTPLFTEKHFGILPLLTGTLLTTTIAILLAVPLGLIIAVYLNEYASPGFTSFVKPVLEVLAAIPTVVYGFFALQFVTPLLQKIIPGLSGFNAL